MFEIKFDIYYYSEKLEKLDIKITETTWKIITVEIINNFRQKELDILNNSFSFIGEYNLQKFYLKSEGILYDNCKTKKEIEVLENIVGNTILKQVEKQIKNYQKIKIVSVNNLVVINNHKRKNSKEEICSIKKIKYT